MPPLIHPVIRQPLKFEFKLLFFCMQDYNFKFFMLNFWLVGIFFFDDSVEEFIKYENLLLFLKIPLSSHYCYFTWIFKFFNTTLYVKKVHYIFVDLNIFVPFHWHF